MGGYTVGQLARLGGFFDADHAFQQQIASSYVHDPRFAVTYDAIAHGLAAWLKAAIDANADRHA